MTISPLIPYIPAVLSFFIYGAIIGGLWAYGRRGRHGCLFTLGFWYLFAVLVVFFVLLLSVQERTNQICFLAGLLLPSVRRAWEHEIIQAPIEVFAEGARFVQDTTANLKAAWQAKSQPHKPEDRAEAQNAHSATDDALKREQERREAEARAKREYAERERQEQERKSDPPEQGSRDSRTPEEVLGLKGGWTQEDLKTAYKREAGRTHPDKWIGKPEAIRQLMEAEYKVIQEAYRRLKS